MSVPRGTVILRSGECDIASKDQASLALSCCCTSLPVGLEFLSKKYYGLNQVTILSAAVHQ
jgi:hypothetical protein